MSEYAMLWCPGLRKMLPLHDIVEAKVYDNGGMEIMLATGEEHILFDDEAEAALRYLDNHSDEYGWEER